MTLGNGSQALRSVWQGWEDSKDSLHLDLNAGCFLTKLLSGHPVTVCYLVSLVPDKFGDKKY